MAIGDRGAARILSAFRTNWRGEVTTVVGAGHSIDPKRVASQLEAQRNGKALPFAISFARKFATAL
jgi:hypothetical protein